MIVPGIDGVVDGSLISRQGTRGRRRKTGIVSGSTNMSANLHPTRTVAVVRELNMYDNTVAWLASLVMSR